MRIRQIKPDFFLDDKLAVHCCRDARLLFTGLWVMADRRGRLEDRPARIKAQVFPYDDDVSASYVDKLLSELTLGQFIIRYHAAGLDLIQIRTFEKHQHCHINEQESRLPSPEHDASTVQAPDKHRTCTHTSTSTSTSTSGGCGEGASTVQAPYLHQKTSLPKELETDKQSDKPNGKTRGETKGIPVPAQFVVPTEAKAWAARRAPTVDVAAETEKFVAHYTAKGELRVDWDAAWRKWILNAVDIQARVPKNSTGPPTEVKWQELKAKFGNVESAGGQHGPGGLAAKAQ